MFRLLSSKVIYLLLFPFSVWGFEVNVVDQFGEPVKDAVVSIPEGRIDQVHPDSAIMDQIDRRFVPLVLAVEKGRNIIFPNSDNIRHHVYSFSKPKSFQISLYKGVPKTPLSFDEEGIVVLGCNIHDSMVGYIFVSPWPIFEVTPVSGQLRFAGNPKEIAIWHPWVAGLTNPFILNAEEIEKNGGQVVLNITRPEPVKKLGNKFKKFYKDE